MLLYYGFYLKYCLHLVNYTYSLPVIVSGSAICNVCQFLLMPGISMRSFIEEDIHVAP